MGTPSIISYFDGKIYKAIYCQWDGYPEHNGLILKKYYKNEDKIKSLIELGYLSNLREEIGEKHDIFDLSKGNWTTALYRDKNEKYRAAYECDRIDLLEKFATDIGVSYLYIYKDNEWKCYEYKPTFIELKEDV